MSGAFGSLRTVNSARSWNVSLGSSLEIRRVRFLILKNWRTVAGTALEHIVPVDVHEAGRCQVQSRPGNDAGLDSDVVEVMILQVGCRFDLQQTPSIVPSALQYVHPHEHAAEDLRVVFARHHGFRSRDEGGEEPVERLDVHRLAAFAIFEEVPEAVKFGVGQRLVLGEGSHGDVQTLTATVYDTIHGYGSS